MNFLCGILPFEVQVLNSLTLAHATGMQSIAWQIYIVRLTVGNYTASGQQWHAVHH